VVKTHGWLQPKARTDIRKAYEVDNFADLWLCDFMHGPQVRVGNRTAKAILCVILDDHTRMVVGQRIGRQDTWVRKMSSRVANAVRNAMLNDGIRDTGCGLKIFYRDDFLRLPAFDHMHRFLPALVQRDGGLVGCVPVNHRPRLRGQSKYGIGNRLWVGITDLFGVMWLQKRRL